MTIDALDVDEAHDRVIAGPAKRDRAISKKEREWWLTTKQGIQSLVWS